MKNCYNYHLLNLTKLNKREVLFDPADSLVCFLQSNSFTFLRFTLPWKHGFYIESEFNAFMCFQDKVGVCTSANYRLRFFFFFKAQKVIYDNKINQCCIENVTAVPSNK